MPSSAPVSGAGEVALVNVDVQAELIPVMAAEARKKFHPVAGVLRVVFLQFNHQQVMLAALFAPEVDNDVGQYCVGFPLPVALGNPLQVLFRQAVAVIFAVHVPWGEERLHVYCQAVRGRALVNPLKVQRGRLSPEPFNCGSHRGFHLSSVIFDQEG